MVTVAPVLLQSILIWLCQVTAAWNYNKISILKGLQDKGTNALGQFDKRVRTNEQTLQMIGNQGFNASLNSFNDNDNIIDDYKRLLNT